MSEVRYYEGIGRRKRATAGCGCILAMGRSRSTTSPWTSIWPLPGSAAGDRAAQADQQREPL